MRKFLILGLKTLKKKKNLLRIKANWTNYKEGKRPFFKNFLNLRDGLVEHLITNIFFLCLKKKENSIFKFLRPSETRNYNKR